VLFTICDHFEPFWKQASDATAYKRVKTWVDCYPKIARDHQDSFGGHPRHCFFFPEEEYRKELLRLLQEICSADYGEVEIHLHHDNDTADNLRTTLINYKKVLSEEHGFLSTDKETREVKYGFIHGNWALDNSRPDGRWCGVNNELAVLQDTGCYADFTMPSAPSDTQTRTINSIYYAKGVPGKSKSHDTGSPAQAGKEQEGLLCIQGPLCLNIRSRSLGLFPRVENGRIASDFPVSPEGRVPKWVNQRIHIQGRPDVIFIKLYSHGAQDTDMNFFFEQGGLDQLFNAIEQFCDERNYFLHYVSARQMYNVVKAFEAMPDARVRDVLDYKLLRIS